MRPLFVPASIVVAFAFGCAPNAHDLESLNATQARQLAISGKPLHFSLLKTLPPEAAAELVSNFRGNCIFFGSHLNLTVDAAKELSRSQSGLWFDVSTLTVPTAMALQPHRNSLSVAGFDKTTIDLALAVALAGHKGNLRLIALQTLTPEVAAVLARCEGDLGLLEVTNISQSAAQHLMRHKNVRIDKSKNPNMSRYKSEDQREQEEADQASMLKTIRENADRGFLVEYGKNTREVVIGQPFHRLSLTDKESLLRQIADYVTPDQSVPCTITVYDSEPHYDGPRKSKKLGEFVRDKSRMDSGFRRVGER